MALELDCLGADLILPSDVQMIARWTVAGCSENIGDGGACLASEIEFDKVTHQFRNRSRLYVPSTEPMIHAYDVDIRSIQPDLDAQKQQYKTKVGDEIIRDIDDTKDCQLRALACQTGGSGWLVGVGELEKFCVWKRKSSSNLKVSFAVHAKIEKVADTARPWSFRYETYCQGEHRLYRMAIRTDILHRNRFVKRRNQHSRRRI